MNRKLSPASRRVLSVLTAILGLGLLVALAFSLNALFSSRTSQIENRRGALTPQRLAPSSPILTDQTKSMGGWGVYKDSVYQYSIQYPPSWDVYQVAEGPEKNRRVDFVSHPLPLEIDEEASPTISILVYDNPSGLPLKKWIESQFLKGLPVNVQKGILREQTEVGEAVGEKITGLPSRWGTLDVLVSSGDHIYRFSLSPYDPENPVFAKPSIESAKLFHQMLGTFKAD